MSSLFLFVPWETINVSPRIGSLEFLPPSSLGAWCENNKDCIADSASKTLPCPFTGLEVVSVLVSYRAFVVAERVGIFVGIRRGQRRLGDGNIEYGVVDSSFMSVDSLKGR